ncbi:MAG: hypothetical protein PHE79_01540 [Eubacteriales bacterium]|nr:hypothetical protein [Eubacteriales bacterium]
MQAEKININEQVKNLVNDEEITSRIIKFFKEDNNFGENWNSLIVDGELFCEDHEVKLLLWYRVNELADDFILIEKETHKLNELVEIIKQEYKCDTFLDWLLDNFVKDVLATYSDTEVIRNIDADQLKYIFKEVMFNYVIFKDNKKRYELFKQYDIDLIYKISNIIEFSFFCILERRLSKDSFFKELQISFGLPEEINNYLWKCYSEYKSELQFKYIFEKMDEFDEFIKNYKNKT